MTAKPAHLSTEIGAGFKDQQVVASYHHRPPYPAEAIDLLVQLASHGPRTVLDLGCGTGDLARRLAPRLDRVDAVDFSAAMISRGRELPDGDHPALRWQVGPAEEAPLAPPYALVTAGESLHWMDWDVMLPRIASVLAPGGVLALVDRRWGGPPALDEALGPIFQEFSSVRDYRPYDLVDELEQRALFTRTDERQCGPEAWRPTIDDYLDGRHSQRGFSRAHMADAAGFDRAVRDVLGRLIAGGDLTTTGDRLELSAGGRVSWGTPTAAH